MTRRPTRRTGPSLASRLARRLIATVSATAVAVLQVAPAYAQVVADGATATDVATSGAVINVTSGTIRNSTAFNSFSRFDVGAGSTVNVYQPGGADRLVNVIRNGGSTIAGTLNAKVGSPLADLGIGGDVYFVNPDGFVVSAGGIINAGRLTLSTPTGAFADQLVAELGGQSAARLFAGTEPIDPAAGITIGGTINAERLEVRSGSLNMMMSGRIAVDAPGTSGTIAPAVNTDGIPTAGGATVEGGVIRLFASGDMQLRGQSSAKRGGGSGGLVEAQSGGEMTVGGTVDVAASGAAGGGSVVLFAQGSAIMEEALRVDARSVAGDGGFFALGSAGAVTAAGTLDTGSDSGASGEAFVTGESVSVTGDIVTGGGDLALVAAQAVTVAEGVGLSTRAIVPGGGQDAFAGAAGAGAAGDLLIAGTNVTVSTGARLRADSAAAEGGGLIGIFTRSENEGIAWAINPDAEVASVSIDGASVTGGAVAITAVARVANALGSDDEAVEGAQVDAAESSATEEQIQQLLDQAVDTVTGVFERTLQTANGYVPLQVQVLTADAKVTITDSQIEAQGNWTDAGQAPETPDDATAFAVNGQLASTGLREDGYRFLGEGVYALNAKLPTAWDSASDSLLIQSHADTSLTIAPKAYLLGIGIAATETHSRVEVANSSLTTRAGGVRLASTAFENHNVTVASTAVANLAGALIVTVRDLTNQVLVRGGTLNSAGPLRMAALTGKSHANSATANAGMQGTAAVAVNIGVSQALTEAALGGTTTAGGAVALDAETLYFKKSHATSATMGLANVEKLIRSRVLNKAPLTGFAATIRGKATGKPADPNRKPSFGFGMSVDVQVDDDDTFARLGGGYHDLSADARPLTQLGTTSVTAIGANVAVNAAYRFADDDGEGGAGLKRATSAAFGVLTQVLKRQVQIHNQANPSDPITEDEILGRYSNATMMNVGVSTMLGETRAEIGADATVTAGSLDVHAVTRFPNADPLNEIRQEWRDFTAQVSDYNPLGQLNDDPDDDQVPEVSELIAAVNPLTYQTSDAKAKGEAARPGDDSRAVVPGEEQKLALGITVIYFNTDSETSAVIRDGAKVTLDARADVTARQEALFLHIANLPKSLPLFGEAKVNDAIGGAINIARVRSRVEALIESGAEVTVTGGDLTLEATTRNFVGNLAYSGGNGAEVAINASISANIAEAETIARIGEAATVSAGAVSLTARDSSIDWAAAGAVSASENIGVGASGNVNFATRRIYAGIGPAEGVEPVAPDGHTVVDAGSLTILAENDTLEIGVAVAGSKVAGKPTTEPPPEENEEDMIIPSWFFDEDENDAIGQQAEVDTPPDAEGNQQKAGWSVSAAASLNLILGNSTTAEIATPARVDLPGAMGVTARNRGVGVTVGGAVAAGLGKTQDTNALAGAFAIHVDTREIDARVSGAAVEAGGVVTLHADDQATVVNVAVGGAGTSRGGMALAGSVAVAVLEGGAEAEVADAGITAESVRVEADDASLTVGIGGAVGINMDKTQGYGVGIGIAVNTVDRSATAGVTGASSVTTGALSVLADTTQSIYGFGVSAGVGKTGIAGSVAVNTITGGAKAAVVGAEGERVELRASSVNVDATETNTIFSLGGALTGGQTAAVGGAATVNVVTADTAGRLEQVDLARRDGGPELGAVKVDADSTSDIFSIAVAGAAAREGTAVGVGLSANEITADVTVSLAGSTVAQAASLTARADATRIIKSIGGGAAASGRGAGGFAGTVNLLLANNTRVLLDGATLSTRDGGDMTVEALAGGEFASLAAALSASRDLSLGGAVTVNVTTAETFISAVGADLTAGGALALRARDTASVESLAGGAAVSVSGTGVAGAVAANFIAHETAVTADGAMLEGVGVELHAGNESEIDSMAVGLAGGGQNAVAGSIAIGDIGNTTRVQAANASLDAGTGAAVLAASRSGSIEILSGSAAIGGNNAVGIALTVATIHGGVTADLVTAAPVTAGSLSVQATNAATIDAIAAGVAGSGATSVAGSMVYSQIGRPGDDGPSVEPLPGPAEEDPLSEAQDTAADRRDTAVSDLVGSTATTTADSLSADQMTLELDSDDIVRARVQLTGASPVLPATTISTSETGATRALAGAAAIGGSNGIGAGITVNLMFGKLEAELVLPAGQETRAAGEVNVSATQLGSIRTAGVSGGVGGAVGGAGSITVNVMNRQADARIVGAGTGTRAALRTDRGAVNVSALQTGTIKSFAGAAGASGTAGAGGAIVVNVMSDDGEAAIEDATVLTRRETEDPGAPLAAAGAVAVTATQTMTLEALSAAVGGGATGAFAGSFALNVADGLVTAAARRSGIQASSLTLAASAAPNLTANAGAVAADGGASVGVGISINAARQTVRADFDASSLLAHDAVRITADAVTTLAANAISGAISGGIAVTGTGIGNTAANVVEALVRDKDNAGGPERSDIVTRGSILLSAIGRNSISMLGGEDELPGANLSISGGGAAGVGASASVSTLGNRVRAAVLDDARLIGLGHSTLSHVDADGATQFVTGLAVNAQGRSDITMLTANGSVGGVAGVSALFSFNLIDDSARVEIGSEGDLTLQRLNPQFDTDYASAIGTTDAAAAQDTVLNADIDNRAESYAVNVAIGGTAGVGAAAGTTLATSAAEVATWAADIAARRDVLVSAGADTEVESYVAGAGGGFVGVAANANVTTIGADALVTLAGTDVSAGRHLRLDTLVDSGVTTFAGGAAGGAVGVAGAVQVTVFDGTSRIAIGSAGPNRQSDLSATDELTVDARTQIGTDTGSAALAGGAGALALSANVSLVKATTAVDVGAAQRLSSGDAMRLSAQDTVTLRGKGGTVGVGAVGIGAALDYASFAGTTRVTVGAGSTLAANAIGAPTDGGLTLSAKSVRDISSGVVAAGTGAVAVGAAISVVELGARAEDDEGERDGLLGDVEGELASDQSGESGLDGSASAEDRQNTGGSLVGFAGGADTQEKVVDRRRSTDLLGDVGEDVVRVDVGDGASLATRGDLSATAGAETKVVQLGGAGSASLAGGMSSGTAVSNVGTGAAVELGTNTRVAADGAVTLNAGTGGIGGEPAVAARAATLGASFGYNAGVGVALARVSGTATVDVGGGARIGGLTRTRAASVDFGATRSDRITADVFNVSFSGVAGAGLAVAETAIEGGTGITVGAAAIRGEDIRLTAADTTDAEAVGEGSTGGILGGLNSVVVTARNAATGLMNVSGAALIGDTVTLSNRSAGRADATAKGIAVGAVAVGASVARARAEMTLQTTVDASIIADTDIDIATRLARPAALLGVERANAQARASSTSGGLLAGNGAEAEAWFDYDVETSVAGFLQAGNAIAIAAEAQEVSADAFATGRALAALALGVTIARAGQEDGASARVATLVDGATLASTDGTVDISSGNAPDVAARALSGSGGLVSGAGAEVRVDTDATTLTDIARNAAVRIDVETLNIEAGHAATLAGKVDTTSAAALGVSGADIRSTLGSDVDLGIGSGASLNARNFEIAATNAMTRPEDGFNVRSGSGGALDVAAMVSRVDASSSTDVSVAGGAELIQTDLRDAGQRFRIGAFSDLTLIDRLKLDSGGAIAVPIGDSEVRANSNTTKVTVGAARLFGMDTIEIYSGGDSDIVSEVDTKSYGAAGAASALSEATYNARNDIVLLSGAQIESMNDVELQAGYGAAAAQRVAVKAESRVFNKTAFPISTDPKADATADTASRVTVGEGARVLAVRDVYLLAEEGGREVKGYGRGKDLYRQVLAEIGSAISEAFVGEPVSLDIETGTTVDRRTNDGIRVNGYVRAGSRNRQVLILDENDRLANGLETDPLTRQPYSNELAGDVEFSIRENVNLSSEIAARIATLNELISDPILSQDQQAVIAWTAERDQLVARAATISGTANFVDLGDIVATEGNIVMRADFVQGAGTGTLEAPGNARIIVHLYSDSYLTTAGMAIPENEGGRIHFNDIAVTNTGEVRALSGQRPGSYDYAMISGDQAGEPVIEVVTYGDGSIIVDGPIENRDGLIDINSNFGDLDVRDDVSGRTVRLSAGRDFVQGFTWGFTNVDGEPDEIYESYFARNDRIARGYTLAGVSVSGRAGGNFSAPFLGPVPRFQLAPRRGQIRAGRNVYITADKLNINGLVQAGTGHYDIAINAGFDGFVRDKLGSGDLPRTGRTLVYDTATPVTDNVVRNAHITSNVRIYYDAGDGTLGDGRIVVDPMVVQGGRVELTGQLLSTGSGEIQSLDGFGAIDVVNDSSLPIVFDRIDLGESGEGQQGIEGVVRISDTDPSRMLSPTRPLITEYRRIGDRLEVRDNRSFELDEIDFDDDGVTDVTREIPTRLVSTSEAAEGRNGSFQPVANRDFIVVRGETVTQKTNYTQKTFYFWAPLSDSVNSRTDPAVATPLDPVTTPGLDGPYLGASLGGGDYPYAFSSRRTKNSNSGRQEEKTDDGRFLGIGTVTKTWSETQTAEHLYTHRLKADYPIAITFQGADTGKLDIQSVGDVMFGDLVSNQIGDSEIRSTAGSVMTTDSSVTLAVADLDLASNVGSVRSLASPMRIDQAEGAVLSVVAREEIDIYEVSGNMLVGEIRTTERSANPNTDPVGEVRLQAQDSILMADGGAGVTGSEIELRAHGGTIGADGAPLRVNVDDLSLTARARGDVFIAETSGDLPVREVVSDTGSVALFAPTGSITDRNDVEVRDIRSEAQLVSLWGDQLGLYGDEATDARRAEQLGALKEERERTYDDYWQERLADGNASQTFALDAATRQSLADAGWTEAQLDAYVDDRQSLYDRWNAEAAYDPGYEYLPSADEAAKVLDGLEWSQDELQQWVRAGLIRGTGDTQVRIEDPNVSAFGDINLYARDQVGELLEPYTLGEGSGLAEDLRVLAGAERTDLSFEGDKVIVRRDEDVNFAFTGVVEGVAQGNLRARAQNFEVFLGAETPATIAEVIGTSDVSIKIDGEMRDNRDGAAAVTGSAIIVESGEDASIGTGDDALTVDVLPGGSLIARSGVEVNVRAIGDMPLAEIFAGDIARLTAAGAITDQVGSGAVRVRAGDLEIDGGSAGTEDTRLVVELTDLENGRLNLETRTGDAWLHGIGGLPVERSRIAARGGLSATGALTVHEGPGVVSHGDLWVDAASLLQRADILSNGGAITARTVGELRQVADTRIYSGTGTIAVETGAELILARLETENATARALSVTTGGALTVAPGEAGQGLVANEPGAGATLRLASFEPIGPEGLRVALATLDAEVTSGALHLQEQDGLILERVVTSDALIDVVTNGDTVVRTLDSGTGPSVISAVTGDVMADAASLAGGDIRLFAFGGALRGESGATFTGDAVPGAALHFYARDNVRYRETAGDLRVGFALSETGDVALEPGPGRALEVGVLGTPNDLTLTATGELRLNVVGYALVDLADEVALQLVRPELYGTREAQSPDEADLTVLGDPGRLHVGLISLREKLGLHAEDIDVNFYDLTAADGMDLVVEDPEGDFADRVDVDGIGDGPRLFIADYFRDIRSRLRGRDRSGGELRLTYGRIGTGQISHAGPRFIGQDVVIDGDVWFRQRSFDLLAQVEFDRLSTVADAQVLANQGGRIGFSISDEIVLVTEHVLVLNRRLGGVDLNGGQGFAFGVGVETDFLGFPFTFEEDEGGVTRTAAMPKVSVGAGDAVRVPLIHSSAD
ncbi:leukotoxin LktA family filamentous adhesin [Roseitranquillus sediminis]|uniref:leukotoxin LktA family filamentous adhesin n=1 Tax=Roseitranquillus sediminis TaxID=2809051 RepID=UPI001D0C9AAF|nr:leukotoxin LktA family filamentous adhesin [Roseitranquillus sediminis]MBM9595918.1 leukotoxin LktA family filamentous adhesin [Roseitranquillus sediminis]